MGKNDKASAVELFLHKRMENAMRLKDMTERDYKVTEPEKPLPLETYSQTPLPLGFCPDSEKYSNTIELYDALPKYYYGRGKDLQRVDGRFLDPLVRDFKYRDPGQSDYKNIRCVVLPAKILDKDGVWRDYYPGKREELVEDALRKMAARYKGAYLNNQVSVIFSLGELQRELKERGHGFDKHQLRQSLEICAQAGIIIEDIDSKKRFESHIFSTLGIQDHDEYCQRKGVAGRNRNARCFVRFNPLVTACLDQGTYRLINYVKTMSFENNIARWLHKRMAHNYKQARWDKPYELKATSIIRDSAMKAFGRFTDNLRDIRIALKELQEKKVVCDWQGRLIKDTKDRRKIVDCLFTLHPHPEFTSDVVKANEHSRW